STEHQEGHPARLARSVCSQPAGAGRCGKCHGAGPSAAKRVPTNVRLSIEPRNETTHPTSKSDDLFAVCPRENICDAASTVPFCQHLCSIPNCSASVQEAEFPADELRVRTEAEICRTVVTDYASQTIVLRGSPNTVPNRGDGCYSCWRINKTNLPKGNFVHMR